MRNWMIASIYFGIQAGVFLMLAEQNYGWKHYDAEAQCSIIGGFCWLLSFMLPLVGLFRVADKHLSQSRDGN